ncbi:MAG TPA: flavin reductase family protein [Candidatus Krumholzibacteria bacterium]|nr:flavin reductase family protein [Candidatus Krumholzibacteria bacterium]
MEIDPASLRTRDRYKLLIGGILPRPIAVVSTVSTDGAANLAPYSFFNGVGSDPMMLLFCPANDADGQEKDTLRNAKPSDEGGTGEFVVNVAPQAMIERIAGAAEALPHGQSEFDFAGLEPSPARVVRPPRLLGSPVAYECRTHSVIRTNPGVSAGGNVVMGEVVHVFVDDAAIDAERLRIDPGALDLAGRLGGFGYTYTRDRFDVVSGRKALEEGRRRKS